MQFLVIGIGRFGKAVAEALADAGHEVVAVDEKEEAVLEVETKVSQALVMDATNERALRTLGIGDFDAVIVATSQNIESSLLITMLAKELGAKKIVAKTATPLQAKVLKRLGADLVVYPERDMGQRVAQLLTSPMIFEFIELSPTHSLVEIVAPEAFAGKTIGETKARTRYGVNIIGIKRRVPEMDEDGKVTYKEETIIIPSAEEEIARGDLLIVIGRDEDIDALKRL
ncbi:MAG: TrkA family potassium uptake protein [candidate division WOR-3 bacterium]